MKRWRRLDYAVVLDRWKTVLSEANEVQSMRDLKVGLLPAMVERWCLARARRRSYRATWQCFGGWKELKGVKELRKQFEVKLARRWRNLDIARPFCTWQRITWHNVRQQRAWQRQVRRMEINVLGAAFRKFAHTIVGKWDLETCTYCVFCPRLGLLMICSWFVTRQRFGGWAATSVDASADGKSKDYHGYLPTGMLAQLRGRGYPACAGKGSYQGENAAHLACQPISIGLSGYVGLLLLKRQRAMRSSR
jgi:hypothetical protein